MKAMITFCILFIYLLVSLGIVFYFISREGIDGSLQQKAKKDLTLKPKKMKMEYSFVKSLTKINPPGYPQYWLSPHPRISQ